MAPFYCSGTLILNNRVSKIDKESGENVDSISLSNKKDELCWDILLWLRTAALDPCKQKPRLEKLRRIQILKAREHISLSTTEFPWKKRKLDLLQNESATSPPLAKPNEQSSFSSLVPWLVSSTESTEMSQQCLCKPSISVGSLRYHDDLSRKRVRDSPFYESTIQLITNTNFSPLSDSEDSVDNLSVSSENSQEKHKTARRSPRLENFIGDYLPRIEVRVGTRHQADIPDWIGPRKSHNSSTDGKSDSFDSKYMGTKIWPIESKSTEDSKEEGIGKGRSNSCSCYSKGCGGCIKLHVFKKGLQLRDDLGTAFFTWKFDEIGEEVSNSWTAEEQQCFDALVKTNPINLTDSFLEPASKQFPGKCKISILSYYFNVFILRRMSKQIRLAAKLVNSNDDNDAFVRKSSIKRKNTNT
ncbi:hypothetical protein MKX01_013084 [Papaver californicum]|nr:hypothetical protein MKX01_013084 [Papaver californicum]